MKRPSVICPICQREMRSSRLATHVRKIHKGELFADAVTAILAGARKKFRSPGRAWIKAKKRDQKEIEKVMRKLTERTPFSMRQWGEDRPRRTGPI